MEKNQNYKDSSGKKKIYVFRISKLCDLIFEFIFKKTFTVIQMDHLHGNYFVHFRKEIIVALKDNYMMDQNKHNK